MRKRSINKNTVCILFNNKILSLLFFQFIAKYSESVRYGFHVLQDNL